MQSTLFCLSVLSFSTLVAATPVSTPLRSRATPAIAGYDHVGCYTEVDGRTLRDKVTYDDGMTLEICAASCAGYTWWGVEYGRECYCGNTRQTDSITVPAAECSFSCPGNAAESCGAGNRLTTYAKTGTTTPADGTSARYGALGCYTEGTTMRALTDASIANDKMTVENCAAACVGYTYFGLEYAHECYCGNTLSAGSTRDLDSTCPYACVGNSAENCGGDRHLQLYEFGVNDAAPQNAVTTYGRMACYVETYSTRVLSGSNYFNDAMTVEKCATACAGYTYFGLEYGRECYCGNSMTTTTYIVSDSECNFLCPGNEAEFCGAGNRLDIYKFGLASTSTSSSVVSSSTSSSVLSSSSTTITASSSAPSVTSLSPSSAAATSSSSSIVSSTTSQSSSSSVAASSSSSSSLVLSSSGIASSSSSAFSSSSSSSSSNAATSTTAAPANPAPTTILLLNNGAYKNRAVIVVNHYLQFNYSVTAGTPEPIAVILAGGQPYLASDPTQKLFLRGASPIFAPLYFETVAAAGTSDAAVNCVVNSGIMTCSSANGFNTIFVCGAYLYLAKPTWPQSGCTAQTLSLATTT